MCCFFAAPAHFAVKHENKTARLGSNTSLRCEAKGDHPLKLIWRKVGMPLDSIITNYRYMIKEVNMTDGTASILGLVGTTREDSGRYICIAQNAYGRDEMTMHLYIQGKWRVGREHIEKLCNFWYLSFLAMKNIIQDTLEKKLIVLTSRMFEMVETAQYHTKYSYFVSSESYRTW